MKETKNYKLNLPQDTDYVDIEDFNSNFNNIDNIVKENNESINNNDKSIVEINNKVTELEKKISGGSSGGSSSSGSEVDESKLNELKQELDKKIQNFIDTKNKINGIAGLDEEGKVKKEQLPEIKSSKIASGEWSDLNTIISKAYIKKIMIGFMPDILSVYVETSNINKKINKERFYSTKEQFKIVINFREDTMQFSKLEDHHLINNQLYSLRDRNAIVHIGIDTSNYDNDSSIIKPISRCVLESLAMKENQLEINFDCKLINGNDSSENNRVYLNIENFKWYAYKF